jgi:hypothetical protein
MVVHCRGLLVPLPDPFCRESPHSMPSEPPFAGSLQDAALAACFV